MVLLNNNTIHQINSKINMRYKWGLNKIINMKINLRMVIKIWLGTFIKLI